MKIQRDHKLGKDGVRKRVDEIADRLCAKYGLRSSWNNDCLNIDGSGVNGSIAVTDETVDVDVRLGFALSMLEGTIRTSIEDALDEHLS